MQIVQEISARLVNLLGKKIPFKFTRSNYVDIKKCAMHCVKAFSVFLFCAHPLLALSNHLTSLLATLACLLFVVTRTIPEYGCPFSVSILCSGCVYAN